jgi:hypothetical protein
MNFIAWHSRSRTQILELGTSEVLVGQAYWNTQQVNYQGECYIYEECVLDLINVELNKMNEGL